MVCRLSDEDEKINFGLRLPVEILTPLSFSILVKPKKSTFKGRIILIGKMSQTATVY